MTDPIGLRRIRLHGTPCPDCGLPAEGMHTLGPWTRIYHVHGWYCDLGGQPPSHFTYSQPSITIARSQSTGDAA